MFSFFVLAVFVFPLFGAVEIPEGIKLDTGSLNVMEMAQFCLAKLNQYQLDEQLYYLINIVYCRQISPNSYVERLVVAPVKNCSFVPKKNEKKCNIQDIRDLKVVNFHVVQTQTSHGRIFYVKNIRPIVLPDYLVFHPVNRLIADNNVISPMKVVRV